MMGAVCGSAIDSKTMRRLGRLQRRGERGKRNARRQSVPIRQAAAPAMRADARRRSRHPAGGRYPGDTRRFDECAAAVASALQAVQRVSAGAERPVVCAAMARMVRPSVLHRLDGFIGAVDLADSPRPQIENDGVREQHVLQYFLLRTGRPDEGSGRQRAAFVSSP